MTSVAHSSSLSFSDFPDLATSERRGFREIVRDLQRNLSEADRRNCYDLEEIFHNSTKFKTTEEYQLSLTEAFESPSYGDDAKRCFAADYIDSHYVLISGDRYLTEEILMSYIKIQLMEESIYSRDYFRALMSSSHLSERIMEAVLDGVAQNKIWTVLELIPDRLITPKLIRSWLASEHLRLKNDIARMLASCRIKQTHPEYMDYPDEWTLKMFCGD